MSNKFFITNIFLINYNLYKAVYFILLFILVVSVILIFKYIKLVNKITKGNNLESELNKSLKEKELLLKELNHRVKNNLQIVVSLLSIQARVVKDPEIYLFIEKTESRIKSMLIIHEMLCFSDDVSKVNFK